MVFAGCDFSVAVDYQCLNQSKSKIISFGHSIKILRPQSCVLEQYKNFCGFSFAKKCNYRQLLRIWPQCHVLSPNQDAYGRGLSYMVSSKCIPNYKWNLKSSLVQHFDLSIASALHQLGLNLWPVIWPSGSCQNFQLFAIHFFFFGLSAPVTSLLAACVSH